jgi:hypothetical protein
VTLSQFEGELKVPRVEGKMCDAQAGDGGGWSLKAALWRKNQAEMEAAVSSATLYCHFVTLLLWSRGLRTTRGFTGGGRGQLDPHSGTEGV